MPSNVRTSPQWTLASVSLADAYTDFILSRQAMQCSRATMEFYSYTAGVFLSWIESQGVTRPDEVTARYVRAYLVHLTERGKSDTTVHDHARAIKTLLRFWHAEEYLPRAVVFDMPKVVKRRLPMLTAEQLETVLKACKNPRDKALMLFMADSGLRRAETIALTWGDVDMQTGNVIVKRGKGGKPRSVFVEPKTLRALLAYRRTLTHREENDPVFQARYGWPLSEGGFLKVFRSLSKRTGIHVTPHAMRRTFTILALRNGMDSLHVQAQLGHATLDMVRHYAQMVDDDLFKAHREHSPLAGINIR